MRKPSDDGVSRRPKRTGSLTEAAPGVWRLRVYAGQHPRTRRSLVVSETVHGTRREADRALAKLLTEVGEGRSRKARETVGDLLDEWLANVRPGLAISTVRDYEGTIDHVLRPALGDVKLSELNAHTLDAWYRHWLTEVVAPSGRRRSRTTVLKYHHIIAAACSQAVKWGWLERNPAKLATPPKSQSPEMTVPSAEEIVAMVERARAARPVLGTAVALAALTGMRRGELCALRWSEVGHDTIVVSHSLTVSKGEILIGDTKTHARRPIALDEFAQNVLADRLAYAEKLAALAGAELVPDAFVLSDRADGARPLLPDTLTHWFGTLMAEMGLPYHLHELRHFMVTTALAAGIDVRTVGGRAGHKDASMTLSRYAHAVAAQDRRAAEALGRALAPFEGALTSNNPPRSPESP